MSFSVTTDLHCDECGERGHGYTGRKMYKTETLAKFKASGWVEIRTGKVRKHLCPICASRRLQ